MEKITQTEWAREIGVSKQYVCYLVKKGIVELEDGLINREQANEAVAAIRDPSQPLRRKNPENTSNLSTMLLKTRIKNEMERGKLLEAKAKAEIGELVAVEEVKREAFNVARVVYITILAAPESMNEKDAEIIEPLAKVRGITVIEMARIIEEKAKKAEKAIIKCEELEDVAKRKIEGAKNKEELQTLLDDCKQKMQRELKRGKR